MKFIVSRTSQYSIDETPPCPGAIKEDLLDDRGRPYPSWTINIDTLEDVLALSQSMNSGLIAEHAHWMREDMATLEIYDDHRE